MLEITLPDVFFVVGVIFFLIALIVILPSMIFDLLFENKVIVEPIKNTKEIIHHSAISPKNKQL